MSEGNETANVNYIANPSLKKTEIDISILLGRVELKEKNQTAY